MGRRNIRVVLSYDGTDFVGWQIQKEGRSVQAVIELALEKIHKHPVHIHAAGRTDSGVHALGQVINFFSDIDTLPAEKFTHALNSLLPFDVRALKSEEVEEGFHARFHARLREYRYYLYPHPIVPPQFRRYCHWLSFRPHVQRLNRMATLIVGTHDFTSFAALGDPNPSKVRTIQSASFFPWGPFLVFRITGTSFLWHMVRNIVGTCLLLDQAGEPPEKILDILHAGNRNLAGDTAPASGLFLHKVEYEDG
ncbi:MAG: tRNA pseudouridine(38-40) synthase TruA [Spirochaetales bacterium]